MKSAMNWLAICIMICLFWTRLASGADAIYQNDGVVNYPGNVNMPPMIDATNFVNTGTFIMDLTYFPGTVQPFYETSDTLNYTNTGLMRCSSGFQFDTRSSVTGLRSAANNFFSSGDVQCKVAADNFTNYPNAGQCLVNATNISVSGTVTVGFGGKIQFAGNNVDLTRSFLTVEGTPTRTTATPDIGIIASWDPSLNLKSTSARSGPINVDPGELFLPSSTPYFTNQTTVTIGAPPGGGTNKVSITNTVIRSVFLQDFNSPGVVVNVYFTTNNPANAIVEWVGTYLNYANGKQITNYLYLKNDYALSGSTNLSINQGNNIPFNFQILQLTTNLSSGVLAKSGFTNAFQPGVITNIYAYVKAQFDLGTVSTNSIQNQAISNMPARVEISANGTLDMPLVHITGPNYISVVATNQFSHSTGTALQAPYVGLNVGATNGFLTLSNTVNPNIQAWGGSITAWSTSWKTTDTNGNTTDYGVLLVSSFVHPSSPVSVQDLIIHGTNSVVISDTMNILRSMFTDAESLTLTANPVKTGAMSPKGELNVQTPAIFWKNSMPNLRNLTNNGAIETLNLEQFFGSSNVVAITPGTPLTAATGRLSEINTNKNVANGNKVIIGTNAYTFVASLTNSVPNLVKIASKFDGSMSNLIVAINHDGPSAGINYSSATLSNLLVTAGALSNHSFVVTAKTAGPFGNSILTTNSASATNLTWNDHLTLFGGADAVSGTTNVSVVSVPYQNFTNSGSISDQGASIWAVNFSNTGTITNGAGSFQLNSQDTKLFGGSIGAVGDISFTANVMSASNALLLAGKSLVLSVTNTLTDLSSSNGNIWSVGGTAGVGLTMPVKPILGDLLGTTIINNAVSNKNVVITWAGRDDGVNVSGFVNNQAIGKLALAGQGDAPFNGQFTFTGTGASNGLYVDLLTLQGSAAFTNSSYDATSLVFNPNLVLYYADARVNGQSIAAQLNGKNNGHLQWVSNFVGNFTAVHVVSFNGTTNVINGGVAKQNILPPTLTTSPQGDGTMKISVSGDGNYLATIQSSTNMVDWTDVYSGYPPFDFTVTNAVDYPSIYYRVKVGQ